MESIRYRLEEILSEINLTRFSPLNGDETEPTGITGIISGFAEIDKLTCGFQRGELIFFSSFPRMGKTAFLMSMINNNLNNNIVIIYFSTQLGMDQVIKMLICNHTRTELHNLQGGYVDKQFTDSIKNVYKKSKIYVEDTSDLDYESMCNLIEQADVENKSIIIIDDINNLNIAMPCYQGESIPEKLAILKKLAKKFRIPILITEQLEIPIENAQRVPEPRINRIDYNLADVCLSLFRPEYFHIAENEEGESLLEKAELTVSGKGCEGGTVYLTYYPDYFLFTDEKKN